MQRMMNVVISDETPTTKMKPEPVGVRPSHPHTLHPDITRLMLYLVGTKRFYRDFSDHELGRIKSIMIT